MSATKKRKAEHIEVCLRNGVEFREKGTGLEEASLKDVELVYHTLPGLDKKGIKLGAEFLGKKFRAPLMVNAITGGYEGARKVNRDIAKACQELGIGMGLGSQRAMIENPKLKESYFVRDVAPDIFLAGNIGVGQLGEYSAKEIGKALDEVKADALAVHLNAAQEAVQHDGSTDFKDCIGQIGKLVKKLRKPVYAKEVGHGISYEVARELSRTGIRAIDVAGAGGTSWIGVDSLRGRREKEIGESYWDFGIPTSASILEVKKGFKGQIVASGGIRNGFQVVKSIILGADIAGIALPVLKAQSKAGSKGVREYLEGVIDEIRVGCFLVGAKDIAELKKRQYVLHGRLREWAEQRKLK